MPLVVGEIIVGIIIGPSVFNLTGRDLTLDFFAEIGLALQLENPDFIVIKDFH